MNTVILCEKHSQAKAIADAMGLSGMSGQYQGRRYTLTWAAGHLLEFESPDDAKPGASWQDPSSLLPLPSRPRLVPSDGGKKGIDRVRSALSSATHVLLSTDPDREGEAIGRHLLQYCRYTGSIERLWLAGGMDGQSIRKALSNLRSSESSMGLLRAQQARSTADWLYMFPTRGYTALGRASCMGSNLGQGKGRSAVVSVGRVQTPTLRMIVERDQSIAQFVPVTHFKPSLNVSQKGTHASLEYAPIITEELQSGTHAGVTWVESDKGDRPLFTDQQAAENFRQTLDNLSSVELTIKRAKASRPAPMCLALIDLQRTANKVLKLSAADTLATAQKLYTDGFISYPRTEHRELPKSAYPDAVSTLNMLSDYGLRPAATAASRHQADGVEMPRAYSGKKMEHHGLMPTTKAPQGLSGREKSVYSLIAQRYIEAHFPDASIERMQVVTTPQVTGLLNESPTRFALVGERIVDPGWMGAFGADKGKATTLPNLVDGPADVTGADLDTAKTKPPAHFTENTLLAAMKNAARFLSGTDAKILASANGLGTPATRASIIETLLVREYILRQKGGVLRATDKGRDLIANTPDRLSDIAMTAEWEAVLSSIEGLDDRQAKAERDAFITEQSEHLTALIQGIVSSLGSTPVPGKSGGGSNGPTPKMHSFAQKIAQALSVNLPEDASISFDACRAFIDEHAQSYKSQMPSANAPTPKMLNLARDIAKKQGKKLSNSVVESFDECKAYLDSAPRAPTPKMADYASKIAAKKQMRLPSDVLSDFAACKAFLNEHAA